VARLRQIMLKGLRHIATQATRHGLRRDGLRSIFCSPHKWPGQRERSELRPLAQPFQVPKDAAWMRAVTSLSACGVFDPSIPVLIIELPCAGHIYDGGESDDVVLSKSGWS